MTRVRSSRSSGVAGTSGSLGGPAGRPEISSAAFTGMGFDVTNSALNSGSSEEWIFHAAERSPDLQSRIISLIRSPTRCEATDTTPAPPRHTNGNVALTASYTAIIDCYNHGVNPNNAVESHQTSFSPTSQAAVTSSKNGQLSVPTRSVSFSGAPIGCPNANWTPTIRPGSQTLNSFSYTLTFAGFTSAYITISQP